MIDEIKERLEKLYKEGKLSLEEKEKLSKLLLEEKKEEERKFPEQVSEIEIENIKIGDLEIEGVEGLTSIRMVRGEENISVNNVGNKVSLTQKFVESGFGIFRNIKFGSKVVLQIPKTIEYLKIKLVSSDVSIKNIAGNLNISLVSGDSEISNFKGDLDLNAISGDIKIENYEGKINISTKSGDIEIIKTSGSIKAKAYSGDIRIENSICKDLNISTYNGDIEISNSSIIGLSYINTIFGDANIDIDPSKVKVFVDSVSGDVESSGIEKSYENGVQFFGKGTSVVYIKSKSGDISLNAIKGGENEGRA